MIYKFESKDEQGESCTLEFSQTEGKLSIFSSYADQDKHYASIEHRLSKHEIDNMIIALTEIKNEIVLLKK